MVYYYKRSLRLNAYTLGYGAELCGSLFTDYIRMINYIRPRFFIMENVKRIMSVPLKHVPAPDRDGNGPEQRLGTILDVILSEFNKLGYKTVCGIALKDIYIKHSKYSIEVDHDELKKQFFEFLRPEKKADENPKNITHEEEIPFLDDEADEAFRARMHLQDVLRNTQLQELETKKFEDEENDDFSF